LLCTNPNAPIVPTGIPLPKKDFVALLALAAWSGKYWVVQSQRTRSTMNHADLLTFPVINSSPQTTCAPVLLRRRTVRSPRAKRASQRCLHSFHCFLWWWECVLFSSHFRGTPSGETALSYPSLCPIQFFAQAGNESLEYVTYTCSLTYEAKHW